MADEPSIDEILASLDQLLKEGEGRNDEPESAPTPDDGDTSSPVPHDAPTPHFFEVLDDEVEPAPAAETGAERGDMPTPETDAASGQDAESRLFVLTEDMRIDEPSLPLGLDDVEDEPGAADDGTGQGTDPGMDAMHQELELPAPDAQESAEAWDSDDADMSEPESESEGLQEAELREPEILPVLASEAEPEPLAEDEPEPESETDMEMPEDTHAEPVPAEAPWDESEIQALVDQVTDDVCSAVAEQLPEMIRTALAERLAAFIDARKNHEDTGTQE